MCTRIKQVGKGQISMANYDFINLETLFGDNNLIGIDAALAAEGHNLNELVFSENPFVRYIVALQGYGLDQLFDDPNTQVRTEVRSVLDRSSMNINEWIEQNPARCAGPGVDVHLDQYKFYYIFQLPHHMAQAIEHALKEQDISAAELSDALDSRVVDLEDTLDYKTILLEEIQKEVDATLSANSAKREIMSEIQEEYAAVIDLVRNPDDAPEAYSQALFVCHRCDDAEAPDGVAWDFTTYAFNTRTESWDEIDGGRYWDYKSAKRLIIEASEPAGYYFRSAEYEIPFKAAEAMIDEGVPIPSWVFVERSVLGERGRTIAQALADWLTEFAQTFMPYQVFDEYGQFNAPEVEAVQIPDLDSANKIAALKEEVISLRQQLQAYRDANPHKLAWHIDGYKANGEIHSIATIDMEHQLAYCIYRNNDNSWTLRIAGMLNQPMQGVSVVHEDFFELLKRAEHVYKTGKTTSAFEEDLPYEYYSKQEEMIPFKGSNETKER